MPHWICKPYYRPVRDDSTISESLYRERRRAELDALAEKTGLSKRQLRKREKRKVSSCGTYRWIMTVVLRLLSLL